MLKMYDVGSYIIHLYDKIDGAFACSQIKLEKMMILAQIEYRSICGENLIGDIDIVFAENCGFSLDTHNIFFRSPITSSNITKDEPLDADCIKALRLYKPSNVLHFTEDTIPDDLKEFIINVFMKYASYAAITLGKILDHIKNCDLFDEFKNKNNASSTFEIPLDEFYKMVDKSKFLYEV